MERDFINKCFKKFMSNRHIVKVAASCQKWTVIKESIQIKYACWFSIYQTNFMLDGIAMYTIEEKIEK